MTSSEVAAGATHSGIDNDEADKRNPQGSRIVDAPRTSN